MGDLKGQIKVLKDNELFDQLDFKKVQKPGITKIQTEKYDGLGIKKLDKIEIKQNGFLEFKDGNSDSTIIPIEFQFDFLSAFRKGIGSIHGPTQEHAGEWLGYKF